MFNFLWDGKQDKISRKTIIQDYENNGLKMIDIDIYIKASNVKRITNETNKGDWKHIYNKQLQKVGGELIFESNINIKDINRIEVKSSFLSEILKACSDMNFKKEIKNVNKQLLWNNLNIKSENKTIFFNDMLEAEIKTIENIFDKRYKVFYTFQEIKDKFVLNNSNFLKYHKLIESIPSVWKQILKK